MTAPAVSGIEMISGILRPIRSVSQLLGCAVVIEPMPPP
jgi:hypothetical protein